MEQYAGVVQPYVEKMPDQLNEPLTPEEYEQVKARASERSRTKFMRCTGKALKNQCRFILEDL